MRRHPRKSPLRRPAIWVASLGVHAVLLGVGTLVLITVALSNPQVVTELELLLAPVSAPAPPPAAPPPPVPVVREEEPPRRLVSPPDQGTNVLTAKPLDESVDIGSFVAPVGPVGWGVAGGIGDGTGGGTGFQQPIPAPPVAPPPTTPTAPPEPVHVGGAIQPPALIRLVEPAYPDFAVWAHVQGNVELQLRVGLDGAVEEAVVVQSLDPLLDEAALEAVRQWKYRPLLLNGEPYPFIVDVTVEFELRRR